MRDQIGKNIKMISGFIVLLLVVLILYQGVSAAGNWATSTTWPNSPDWGYQNWEKQTDTVIWKPTFMWSANPIPTNNRRIELEFYDPAHDNHCNRLEPFDVIEAGGDWIDGFDTDDECDWGEHERLTFWLKESNISSNVYYQAQAHANILYTAGYNGETNASWTCWGCSDHWMGKQIYTSGYTDGGSNP